jgi:XRE family transcriptional regulator, fatty acid utilization regulator
LPQFFGLSNLFFLRFIHNLRTDKIDINKELHLNRRHHPHGNGLDEHYCRRWISVSLLQDLKKATYTEGSFFSEKNQANSTTNPQKGVEKDYIIGIQKSRYFQTEDEYLCFTVARPLSNNRNASLTIGVLIDDAAKKRIRFLDDPNIPSREVSTTCERCAVANCAERVSEPLALQRRENRLKVNEALEKILE